MGSVALTLLVVAILFLSTVVQSTLGFGSALIAMPLLVWVVGVRTATPLVALVAVTMSVGILLRHWRKVEARDVWRLIVASLLGIPLGLLLLKGAPERVVKSILGVSLVGFGLYRLLMPKLPILTHNGLALPFGFIAGVLGGAYNTNGPPIVIYGSLRRWAPEQFRATLQVYFFVTGVLVVAGHGLAGLWTPVVVRWYIYALPGIALGVLLGSRLGRLLSGDRFDRIVNGFLVLMGASLFA